MDSIERTVLFTDFTCNTTNGTVGDYIFTHVFGRALYFNFFLSGQQFDDVFRTCGYTFTTSYTFIFVYYCNAVNDFDCAECTSFFTGAQTQATVRAGFCTATSQLGSECTIVDTEVVIFIFCFFACTAAFYESSNGFGSGCFYAHDSTDFFSYCCTTNGASIYGSCTSYDSGCCTTTTGEAATTTVSTGQTAQNFTNTRVFFYFENFRSNTQASAENDAQTTDTQDGVNNAHRIHILLPSFITV